ncbi:hypothetical protein P7F60_07690 [Rhizobium sp. YJ-22]|uniref:hypothetical protein n=1 Tax=Rhizobium sp. YJ-22 TaxID=3037556 RepID=UPI0024128474|nr:hypothetical protein [Rhizobium sp. YJ-22]MDG3576264.1 hypothetical protein [Rhizobium sp. YJ-22]
MRSGFPSGNAKKGQSVFAIRRKAEMLQDRRSKFHACPTNVKIEAYDRQAKFGHA